MRFTDQYVNYARVASFTPRYNWFERMALSPIMLAEVNKGYLVQNPGY
jgi:hypothetical protein